MEPTRDMVERDILSSIQLKWCFGTPHFFHPLMVCLVAASWRPPEENTRGTKGVAGDGVGRAATLRLAWEERTKWARSRNWSMSGVLASLLACLTRVRGRLDRIGRVLCNADEGAIPTERRRALLEYGGTCVPESGSGLFRIERGRSSDHGIGIPHASRKVDRGTV